MSKDILDSYSEFVQEQVKTGGKRNNEVASLYVHFPFCKHLCNYCDFYKKVPESEKDILNFENQLSEYLALNNNLFKEQGHKFAPLRSLYIGGGTPSLWNPKGLSHFLKLLSEFGIILDSDIEFTMEINPGTLGDQPQKLLSEYLSLGVNRFSMGSQTLNSDLLPYLDRVHSLKEVQDTLCALQKLECNFSVDLMLGLPFSEKFQRNVKEELSQLLSYGPQHFSVYILTVKENYKHYKVLPSEDWIHDEFLTVSHFLKQNDFYHYEVSNFSKKGKESRHNMQYWLSESVAAIGPSATGVIHKLDEAIRYKWASQSVSYDLEKLDKKSLRLEDIYLKLRLNLGLSFDDLGLDWKYLARFDLLGSSWKQKGLADYDPLSHRVTLSSKGLSVDDNLLGELFREFRDL